MKDNVELLKEFAGSVNLSLSDKHIEQFQLFENFIKEYNLHTNLVSSNDINLIMQKHFTDSIAFGNFIQQNSQFNIIDIGSGGGFPVIPMAIILKKCKLVAVDSTKKKTDFLKQAANILSLTNLTVLNMRAEELAHNKEFREKFDIATARAVGSLNQITELCLPFVKTEGNFIAYKSLKIQEETEQAQNAINILGGKIDRVFEYNLQLNENYQRNLLLVKKISQTPDLYPRSFSSIKNKPLGV